MKFMINKFFKFIFVLVILGSGFLFAKSASAATYYMRADGTAATIAAATGPISDVSKCMNSTLFSASNGFVAGDIIYVSSQGGVFSTQINPHSSSAGAPITLQAVDGETPLFDVGSSVNYSITIASRNNWDLRGLHVAGGTSANINISGGSQNVRLYNIVSEGGVSIVNIGTSAGSVIDGLTNTGNITGQYAVLANGNIGNNTWKNITLSNLSVTTAALWWAGTTAGGSLTADTISLTNTAGGGMIVLFLRGQWI
jgi:hypothetical protein